MNPKHLFLFLLLLSYALSLIPITYEQVEAFYNGDSILLLSCTRSNSHDNVSTTNP
jgi:hypothetical protein